MDSKKCNRGAIIFFASNAASSSAFGAAVLCSLNLDKMSYYDQEQNEFVH